VLPALVVVARQGGCFRDFPGVLKAHRLLGGEVVAQVAPPQAVVPVLQRAKRDK
jgi:hypothetical protein